MTRTAGPICIFVILAVIVAAALASSDAEVKVIVYDGPTKCSNKPGDENPTKIEEGSIVGFHFTATVDESSAGPGDVPGRKIESSRDMGIAPSFPVGQGKVIAGLDRGLIGLCKGSSAYIVVPPHLAYGSIGKPEQGVGSETILRYDVEIITIQPPVPNDFVKIDANKDWKISKREAKKYFDGIGQAIDLDALWKSEDNDGDGYISWEEFTGPKGSEGPPPKRTQQPQPKQPQKTQQQAQAEQLEQMASLFQNIDKDQDGKLSKDELGAMFKALGSEMEESFWLESDPDGDGYVLFEEFIGTDKKSDQREEL